MNSKNDGLVVLLAEDDFDLLELLSLQLQGKGEIYGACSGEDAIEQIEVLSHVDVLVTDFQMPKADGLTVAEAFRARFPDGKIILITAASPTDHDRIREMLEMPNVEFLRKPFIFGDLERAIFGARRIEAISG